MEDEGRKERKIVERGVPQGSLLGPTLCNILFDGFLRIDLPDGVSPITFADDMAMKIQAKTEARPTEDGGCSSNTEKENLQGDFRCGRYKHRTNKSNEIYGRLN